MAEETKKYDDEQAKEKLAAIEQKLAAERKEWKEKIHDLIKMIKGTSTLAEAQVFMLSYRQLFVEKITELRALHMKKQKSIDTFYRDQYREYTINYDIKLTPAEKNQFIKADLGNLRMQAELLENQMNFYQESIKTMDTMSFSINNRIKLAEAQLI
jgi:FtsZ-binding cell division protein ZapB